MLTLRHPGTDTVGLTTAGAGLAFQKWVEVGNAWHVHVYTSYVPVEWCEQEDFMKPHTFAEMLLRAAGEGLAPQTVLDMSILGHLRVH